MSTLDGHRGDNHNDDIKYMGLMSKHCVPGRCALMFVGVSMGVCMLANIDAVTF